MGNYHRRDLLRLEDREVTGDSMKDFFIAFLATVLGTMLAMWLYDKYSGQFRQKFIEVNK